VDAPKVGLLLQQSAWVFATWSAFLAYVCASSNVSLRALNAC
jgi:hypothetical protein